MNLFIVMTVLVLGFVGDCYGDDELLENHFYRHSCPAAEDLIQNLTCQFVAANASLPAKFLRMHFHDCFVRGCEASILLDSTANNTAEKDAFPNLSLAGFDVIEAIKTEIEKICPGIVSCADILSLVVRDAVSCQFDKPMWEVLTGRRDGVVSLASEALNDLPSPFSNFATLQQAFAGKNLSSEDLVVLSGAHTIGVANCQFFSNRIYNFDGNGNPDPSLNATYATFLRTQCKGPSDTTTTVPMDGGSGLTFDNHYYTMLKENEGLFQSDAAILTDHSAREYADKMTTNEVFFTKFANSVKRMAAIGVLTGSSGEIRKKCSAIN
ncbi:hypothetical protein Vadar_006256 [Vaccinium darrowii]|uniref:Uncharacterized protein n=1 Tax=Vaccinium darrowii TaxID=229202 RepID=A0ACB7XNQ9_9ERIC|nr:hypothetical protein Vadar_006256 [Vaccinium darrowii]